MTVEGLGVEKLMGEELVREVVYRGVSSPATAGRERMRQMEERAVKKFGIPSLLLMENAALAVVREVKDYSAFAVVCAPGGNGGDGLAVARHLCLLGRDVRVYLVGDPDGGSADFRTNLEIMRKMSPESIYALTEASFEDFEYALKGCETCIDAMFGIGLNRPVEGLPRRAIEAMNRYALHIVSVDVPSGVDTDTGEVLGAAVCAHKTVTFHRMKPCLDLAPQYAGDVVVAYVGIP